jgi:polyphenol oxidase
VSTEESTEPMGPVAEAVGFEQSDLLAREGFVHAFFTRRGGVSEGAFASLNLSSAGGDDPKLVAENLRRVALELGVPAARVYFLSQVHGVRARVLGPEDDRERVLHEEGDITLSLEPGLACGTRYADCVPVLLADRRSGAVAAVHAGWRGVADGAVTAGVAALGALVGAPLDLVAAVGPHISRAAFEVSAEVAEELLRASPDRDVLDLSRHRPHVDLRRIVHAQLRATGIDEAGIDHVGGCTVGDPDRYFSFRRDGAASGRHLAAILARP